VSTARPAAARRRRGPRALPTRWLKAPRTLRPTRAGWVFFAFTLGVGLAAMNTGNNLLYMIHALLLSFLVLSGVMSESALRGIRVRRRLPAELIAERASQVALEIANEQPRIPSFVIVAEDCVRGANGERRVAGRVFALRIGPRERETRSYAFVPRARGALPFSGVRVATRFPFGLFSKAMWVELAQEPIVYPALDPVDVRLGRASEPRAAERAGGSGGAAAESASLREYAPGDAFRRIHWRASLRQGELLVREPEQDRRGDLTVRLATRGAAEGDAFEREVRRAASEVAAHLAVGQRVALRTDRAAFLPGDGMRQRTALLSFLATVLPDPPETAERDAARPAAPSGAP
jgi:uncharacterized protein (DUF58 family)